MSAECMLIVSQSELVIAIYEVGQSFLRGWGVDKDKQMAVVSPLFTAILS
jgi:hypothetical protein